MLRKSNPSADLPLSIMQSQLPILLPVALLGAGVFLISQFSGWAELARKYRTDKVEGLSWHNWLWAKFGVIDYKRCISAATNQNGLYLKLTAWFVYLPGHPWLLIPWSDIENIEECKYWFRSFYQVNIRGSDVRLLLQKTALDGADSYTHRLLQSSDRNIWW